MHSKNESVAVRAAEALFDRGYGRPMQGIELKKQEQVPTNPRIRIEFVTPPKRDENYSIPQHPSLIGFSKAK
jgi:hypothetical protein